MQILLLNFGKDCSKDWHIYEHDYNIPFSDKWLDGKSQSGDWGYVENVCDGSMIQVGGLIALGRVYL